MKNVLTITPQKFPVCD